jgi:putrescine---pyruvate transaminase
LVGGAESCGLMAGFRLMKDKKAHITFDESVEVGMLCRNHCFSNGLIMRAVGDRMIIAPPLVITKAQIDEMMALIVKCLDATLNDLEALGIMHNNALNMNVA